MNRAAIGSLLAKSGAFAPFRFLNRGKLLILMYHRFSESEEFGKTSRPVFERHISYLSRHYRVISLNEAVKRIGNGDDFPPRCAVITIDDGYRDFYDTAFPVLQRMSLPAAIYLVSEFVEGNCWIWTDKARYILADTSEARVQFEIEEERFEMELGNIETRLKAAGILNSKLKKIADEEKDAALRRLAEVMKVDVPDQPPAAYSSLTWDNARQLASGGIEIGSHTATHPILTNVDDGRVFDELVASRSSIENELQQPVEHFCYPNGNVSARERNAAESAGYCSAVTTEITLCERGADKFMLPRIDAEPEMHRFVQATSGFDRFRG